MELLTPNEPYTLTPLPCTLPFMDPKRILLIVFKGIGDVLLTTPLIRALKKRHPSAEIFFLTKKPSEKILRNNPLVSGIIIRGKGALKRIRALKLDTVIDFMRSAPSGWYTRLSGAKQRIAFHYPLGFFFYNIMPRYRDRGYTVHNRLRLLEPLDVRDGDIKLDLNFTGENAAKADAFLAAANLDPAKDLIITFDITSPRGHRMWPGEKFATLADALSEKLGARIIFLAGPGELNCVKKALAAAARPHLVAADFDLLDLAAFFKRVKLHVGTTSSPMHIAVSQGAPTFTVYGARNGPENWGPPLALHGYAQGDLAGLAPDEVFEKIKRHLESLGILI
ncbi:MAG: glycosyltransferase family 9 protein [Elusimicrobia bacterium]|nr:glycosyltransferase family 9 protein [Elusimicrobiota bacterium]